ncbi:MAG: hypothetical protein ABL995_21035, partial [Bryobacteraceae bacterium]
GLKITSLTFLFTDLKGSTALYDRVGDLGAGQPPPAGGRRWSRARRDGGPGALAALGRARLGGGGGGGGGGGAVKKLAICAFGKTSV